MRQPCALKLTPVQICERSHLEVQSEQMDVRQCTAYPLSVCDAARVDILCRKQRLIACSEGVDHKKNPFWSQSVSLTLVHWHHNHKNSNPKPNACQALLLRSQLTVREKPASGNADLKPTNCYPLNLERALVFQTAGFLIWMSRWWPRWPMTWVWVQCYRNIWPSACNTTGY